MQVFRHLGLRIDERWEAADYDESRFPGIAAAELEAAKVCQGVTIPQILRWLLTTRELPAQVDLEGRFGQPPLTVYSGRRFLIQVLLWVEDLMVVHQHSFSGAFLQLAGCGLHREYRFERHREVSQRLWLGELTPAQTELLHPGDVRPITTAMVHANYHLDRPSATVVVRTFNDSRTAPQFFYQPPHLAIDPLAGNADAVRRRQGLRFLLDTDPEAHDELAAALLAEADLHTAVLVILQAAAAVSRLRLARLLDAAHRRHGDAVGLIERVVGERRRQQQLEHARAAILDPELRLLLALLIALGDRDAVLAMLRERYPAADVIPLVDAWLQRLGPRDRRLLAIGDAALPSIAEHTAISAGLLTPLFAGGGARSSGGR
jgi:hypothetical protein